MRIFTLIQTIHSLELSKNYSIIRIATSNELQRILKYCGFELFGNTKKYLFLPKTEIVYSRIAKIRKYLMRVIKTGNDLIDD